MERPELDDDDDNRYKKTKSENVCIRYEPIWYQGDVLSIFKEHIVKYVIGIDKQMIYAYFDHIANGTGIDAKIEFTITRFRAVCQLWKDLSQQSWEEYFPTIPFVKRDYDVIWKYLRQDLLDDKSVFYAFTVNYVHPHRDDKCFIFARMSFLEENGINQSMILPNDEKDVKYEKIMADDICEDEQVIYDMVDENGIEYRVAENGNADYRDDVHDERLNSIARRNIVLASKMVFMKMDINTKDPFPDRRGFDYVESLKTKPFYVLPPPKRLEDLFNIFDAQQLTIQPFTKTEMSPLVKEEFALENHEPSEGEVNADQEDIDKKKKIKEKEIPYGWRAGQIMTMKDMEYNAYDFYADCEPPSPDYEAHYNWKYKQEQEDRSDHWSPI